MWRLLPVIQKPWQVSQRKWYREQGLLETPGAVSLHIGAAQGPGGNRPRVEGASLAMVPGAGWEQDQDQVKE